MARYRIRYQGTDLEMPSGEFVVGRSSACNLALDDALVSRRHATIQVQPDGVFVEDLGSRNGVAVNGERIATKRRLAHLDRVTIGSHELVIVEIADRGPQCDACRAALPLDAAICPRCGHTQHKGHATLAGMTLELPVTRADTMQTARGLPAPSMLPPTSPGQTSPGQLAPPVHAGPSMNPAPTAPALAAMSPPSSSGISTAGSDENTGRALLAGIADKALALGRFDEAERVLGKTLHEMLARTRAGHIPPPSRITEATKYALRLAEGTRRTAWLDWVFELHEAAGRLLGADEIERLHELVRKLRYGGIAPVRRYVDVLRARAETLSPSERFLLSRLEGIERMVSA